MQLKVKSKRLISAKARIKYSNPPAPDCLIVLDGDVSVSLLKHLVKSSQYTIIAADGAANLLYKLKIAPHFIIGDLDSVTLQALKYSMSRKTTIIKITEQEHNDFEKCIMFALSNKLKDITVIGYAGRRTDHMLNNFSVMKRYYRKSNIRFIDNEFEMFFVRKLAQFSCRKGAEISLLAMPKAGGVKTHGLKYPLYDETLQFGKRQGALNKAISNKVKIEVKSGDLLAVKRR